MSRNKTKVLVVDDHLKMRLTISHMLKTAGYDDVVGAGDGDEALRKIEAGGVDFVICDWNMPGMKGVELLQALRERDEFKALPFLMVTAEVNGPTVMQALETEVDGYIVKPFRGSTLLDKMASILKRRSNPSPIDLLLKSAKRKLSRGDVEGAAEDYRRAFKEDQNSPRVHFGLSEVFSAQGQKEEALKELKRSLELAPEYVKACDAIAALLIERGEKIDAAKMLEQAVRKSPLNVKRQAAYGSTLIEIGETEKAREVFQEARKYFPDNAEFESLVGEAYLRAGLHREAEIALEAASALNPDLSNVYNQLGIAYRKQGKYEAAIANYRKALISAPNDANLYYNMAIAQLEAKEADASIKSLKKALEIDPDFREADDLLHKVESLMRR